MHPSCNYDNLADNSSCGEVIARIPSHHVAQTHHTTDYFNHCSSRTLLWLQVPQLGCLSLPALAPPPFLTSCEMNQSCDVAILPPSSHSTQFGHFYKYAKDKCDHPYPVQRYTNEAKRLLGVLEKRLDGREFLIDAGYTIADMATFPWVRCLKVSGMPVLAQWKHFRGSSIGVSSEPEDGWALIEAFMRDNSKTRIMRK